jgi:hypothetical protein
MLLPSCAGFIVENKKDYRIDYLLPIGKKIRNDSFFYKEATGRNPVLLMTDSIAFLDIYAGIIDKKLKYRVVDTLYPHYAYFCKKLGEQYECPDCPPGVMCDCWKCADSSLEVLIFKGKLSDVYLNHDGQFVCAFLDSLLKSKWTIELVSKTAIDSLSFKAQKK